MSDSRDRFCSARPLSVIQMVAFLKQRATALLASCTQKNAQIRLPLWKFLTSPRVCHSAPETYEWPKERENPETGRSQGEEIRVLDMVARMESECLKHQGQREPGSLSGNNSFRRNVGRVLLTNGSSGHRQKWRGLCWHTRHSGAPLAADIYGWRTLCNWASLCKGTGLWWHFSELSRIASRCELPRGQHRGGLSEVTEVESQKSQKSQRWSHKSHRGRVTEVTEVTEVESQKSQRWSHKSHRGGVTKVTEVESQKSQRWSHRSHRGGVTEVTEVESQKSQRWSHRSHRSHRGGVTEVTEVESQKSQRWSHKSHRGRVTEVTEVTEVESQKQSRVSKQLWRIAAEGFPGCKLGLHEALTGAIHKKSRGSEREEEYWSPCDREVTGRQRTMKTPGPTTRGAASPGPLGLRSDLTAIARAF
jgi:hypothetical protein